MLKPAILYKEALKEAAKEILLNPEEYKYWNRVNYITYNNFDISDEDEYRIIKRVSVDSSDKVRGYMCAYIDRTMNAVDCISMLKFDLDHLSITFLRDLEEFFVYLTQHFRKVSFTCVVGNPAEKHYDRAIKKYHGRIVGIQKQEVRLIDEKLYDMKLYEIVKE